MSSFEKILASKVERTALKLPEGPFETEDGVVLSHEQAAAVRDIVDFMNGPDHFLILTGQAGAGKTTVTNFLREQYGSEIAVCATTGRAALLAGGTTVDRMFSINRSTWQFRSFNKLSDTMLYTLKDTRAIMIDEASMIGKRMASLIVDAATQFDKKIILVGDWAQAQPVKDDLDLSVPLFREAHVIKLMECQRQNDAAFLASLNSVRSGCPTPEANEIFSQRIDTNVEETDVVLMYTNAAVSEFNRDRLLDHVARSGEALRIVEQRVFGFADKRLHRGDRDYDRVVRDSPCEDELHLAIGARVMFTMNSGYQADNEESLLDDEPGTHEGPFRYVNGDTGEVVRIKVIGAGGALQEPDGEGLGSRVALWVRLDRNGRTVCVKSRRYDFENERGEAISGVYGLAMRLAYASTVHKSQGCTIPKVFLDTESLRGGGSSTAGLMYVALSRVRSLEDIKLFTWDPALVTAPRGAEALI